ncbi:MAG TPA: CBS domain-containing protein [Chitinophagales bacterium]|nr:CBS domain-containing protein [Chitinophagales bacterium]
MKASELISKNIPSLRTSDTGATALRLMSEFHVLHLPIVNENQLLGLISEEDILNTHGVEEAIGSLPLSFMRPFIKDHEHLFEVMKVASEFRLTAIPVIDNDENYLGVITRDELLNYFALETGILEPGGIIVIEVNVKDYTLADVARIIEQHEAKILGSFAKTNEESNKVQITIKINHTDLQPIIASLARYNYVVKETFTEPEYFDNLKERYDSLMNYLNI